MPSNSNFKTLLDITTHSFSAFSECTLVANVDGDEITYAQAKEKMEALQESLISLGIGQGDKVAICSENMPHWGIAYLAITTMGAVAVPILPDFHSNEIHHIVKHSEAKVIFVSKKMLNKISEDDFTSSLQFVISLESFTQLDDYTKKSELLIKGSERFAQFKAKLTKPEQQKEVNDVTISEDDLFTQLDDYTKKSELLSKGSERFAKFKAKLTKSEQQKEVNDVIISEDDLAVIIYTSGTTGQSKGVMLSHRNLVFQMKQAKGLIIITEKDRFLSILPLAHTLECSVGFLVPFSNGASVYYINRTPAPKIILKAMATVKPTCILSVPLVIEKIYKSKVQASFNKNAVIKYLYNNVAFVRKKLNKIAGKKLHESFGGEVRFFGIGGAKLSPFVEQFLQEANFPYAVGYGLTETSPLIAGAIPGNTKMGTTGIIVEGMEHRFVKYGQESRDAELHVRGPNVMMGYYKDTVRTEEVLDADGWFNTGDLGCMDEHGILSINGRSKNVIIGASGENIYPESIESVLNQNELVSDSLVYELEGRVVAKIHLDYDLFDETHNIQKSSDSALHTEILTILEEIKSEANSQLASFAKIASVFEQTEPFIKTPTKKIKRFLHI